MKAELVFRFQMAVTERQLHAIGEVLQRGIEVTRERRKNAERKSAAIWEGYNEGYGEAFLEDLIWTASVTKPEPRRSEGAASS